MKIRRAIIPAAGLGTRFLPATKAQAKEMLPIVDKPTIQYIVEEAVASGIEEIIIIIGRGKRSIEDHFDKSYELEDALLKKEKLDVLKEVQQISSLATIYYVRQKEPKGLGHAILCAQSFIGNEPFAVLLGDDIVMSETPCLKQIIDVFEYCNSSVVAVQSVPEKDISKYGIVKPKGTMIQPNLFSVDCLVEKPKKEVAPSRYAIMGRYVLRPEIFKILTKLPVNQASNELQLTDAINELNKEQAVLAYNFEGNRYDIGDKVGFIKATIDFALHRDDIRNEVLAYLRDINTQEKSQITKREFE
ncbi:UTP--glucose-1-phosphate uridylyltransferase [Bacillus thuringiensis]|uniref:UTP--glucose-1-phosphate uridylyltransferase n=1 Tax=Bacillus thuringiensis TaxID=1428 RepID=A0ABD6RT58_BACTU|nr:UTP--glucose-1-phosphate uridylyltransferase GalU [Bacillus thuringiensis]PER34578.1 UTP--glucose-1-phosphate uridylyltransferase [Bacillus thuringiensis]PEU69464.1 UTP--glucose-1-phosphate uridylyltransferase [Bacillus thuringiensis]PFI03331.1 UTP--glucose-1-phosphate uridylyltransferase [Bacillus thuringiensis]PFW27259.1 UTP--glucose-1-phosphate uridylyltransferase [Bacillus thuringiensis]PGY60882.1 UTP--glucose-1-phosphate uridylyltransferase [Bacillus thuringiensis]